MNKRQLSLYSRVLSSAFLIGTCTLFSAPIAEAGVILQGFYWDAPSDGGHQWWDLLATNANNFANEGFTAIWLPPSLKGASGGYSNGYDIFDDYDLGSKDQRGTIPTRWGTKTSLVNAVAKLRRAGMEVYLDTVLVHRDGDDGKQNFNYRDSLGGTNGRFPKTAADFTWEHSDFGRGLNFSNPRTHDELIKAGAWRTDTLGTQGLRIDYAKGLPGNFLLDYISTPDLSGQFTFVEYWDENPDVLATYAKAYVNNKISVLDFPLWGKLKDMEMGNGYFDMRNLVNAGYIGRDADHAVTFVENHDTDVSYPTTRNKHLGYAYILTQQGYPCVFWRDYFDYGLKSVIDNLIWIHEKIASGSTVYRWADSDLLVYEREGGTKLLVGLNDNQSTTRTEWVQTGFGANVALHDYSGHMGDTQTNEHGYVQISVPGSSFVALAPPGISGNFTQHPSYYVTQQFTGADDLDIPAARAEKFSPIETISLTAGNPVEYTLDLAGPADVEVQAISTTPGTEGKSFALFRGHSTGHTTGQFLAPATSFYRLQIQAKSANKGPVGFKLQITY